MFIQRLQRLRNTALLWIGTLLLTLSNLATAQETFSPLPLVVDLQKTAQKAQKRKVPIVLFVTASWCHFCHKLKENILEPLLTTTPIENYAEFREVILDKQHWHLKDFNGQLIEMPQLGKRLKIIVTPTTLFLDPKGNELSERIIGLTLEEYYPFYLEQGINRSLKKLGNPKQLDINHPSP